MRFGNTVRIVIAVALPVAAGCASGPKDRLQGKWVGDAVDQFQPDQSIRAQGWASGTTFEFRGARVTITIPAESPREGTFQVAAHNGDDLTVTFLRDQGVTDSAAFRFEGDRLRWLLGDGRSVLLKKVD